MSEGLHVLVVGGGSTGCGIARDCALRGFDVTLIEKGNLTNGTTGRMHGLLHSGARYAVSDRASARQCMAENRVLRDIASHCVEMTGGLFVKRPGDSAEYFEQKVRGCEACDIPVEVVSGEEARDREPYLADDIERAIAVPDGAIDPFRLCVANAKDAADHGARIETHAAVTDVHVERTGSTGPADEAGASPGRQVVGVTVEHGSGPGKADDSLAGTTERIEADCVVNATGAWAGQLGTMAGVDIEVRPSKGVMTVMNVRQVDTVINRCAPKGDADIVVPHETTCILGTTDEEVDHPEDFEEDPAAVDHLIDELGDLLPVLREARTLRSYWGVRPLYEPPDTGTADPTDITRDHFLLDHAERDDLGGLVSIVGGKLVTYRRMAAAVTDLLCERFGIEAPCRTAERPLPGSRDRATLDAAMERFGLTSPIARRSAQRLGDRTEAVLGTAGPNPVVCGCEAVTRAEIQDAISEAGSDLNAVRIRTRASMGNCQGGFCCQGMANELHPEYDPVRVEAAFEDLYQERWKGQRHALWGEQLSQAMLVYTLHGTTMNRDGATPLEDGTPDFAAFDHGPRDDGDPSGQQVEPDGGQIVASDRPDRCGAIEGSGEDNPRGTDPYLRRNLIRPRRNDTSPRRNNKLPRGKDNYFRRNDTHQGDTGATDGD